MFGPRRGATSFQLGQCGWMLKQFEVAKSQLAQPYRLALVSAPANQVLAEFSFALGEVGKVRHGSGISIAFGIGPQAASQLL